MRGYRNEPVAIEVTEAVSQTLEEDLREWPGQAPERSEFKKMNQLSKISLIVSAGSEKHGHRRMVAAAGARRKAIDQAPGQRSPTIVANRPGHPRQPAPAGITQWNQPVVQHPAITQPTVLWREQGINTQAERIEHSHLYSNTSHPCGGAKVTGYWLLVTGF